MTTFAAANPTQKYQERIFTLTELEKAMSDPDMELPEHFEVVEGKIVPMSPTKKPHSRVGLNIIRLLDQFVHPKKLGEITTLEFGYQLAAEPLKIRCPDVGFVRAERVTDDDDYYQGAPDLAVEVVSPGNSADEIVQKVREYLEAGGQLVWVVYPKSKEVHVFRQGENTSTILQGDAEITGEKVIEGFRCRVAEFFE